MQKYNVKKLGHLRLVFASLLLVFTLCYPGHNYFQTLVLTKGPIIAYAPPSPSFSLYPKNDQTTVPYVSSRAVLIKDISSKTDIYAKNADVIMMPASITKLMTAVVALDHWHDLNVAIVVKNEDRAIGQTIDLVKGESITLQNLLYGLLIHSGNDAALTVAENFPGGYDAFVAAMNQKAQSLHMTNTTFKNPSGVEQLGHMTTARDIATLAIYAMQNPEIARIVSIKRIIATDVTGQIIHDLETTNELLGVVSGLKGIKTGWTSGAGECLVSYIERDSHKIIIVVLGSQSRFGDTIKLVQWTFDHHDWITPIL